MIDKAFKLVTKYADFTIKGISVVIINKTNYELKEGFLNKAGCKVEEYKISVDPKAKEIMGVYLSDRVTGCMRSMRVGLIYQIGNTKKFLVIGFSCSWWKHNRVAGKIIKIDDCDYQKMNEILDKFVYEELDEYNISNRRAFEI